MRRRFPTGLKVFLIIASVFITFYGILFIQVLRAVSWKAHEDLTDKQKTDFSEMALMPGLAPSVERYGIKGWQDAEYLIETYRYDSVDAMCDALPDGCREKRPSPPSGEMVERMRFGLTTPALRTRCSTN